MSAVDPKTQEWRKSGEYLPPFMRDFHDQKDLFKALFDVVERANQRAAAAGGGHMVDLTWTASHVYTVDIFLWVMAAHGYTLQKSRKPVPFGDIEKFIKDSKKARDAESANVMLTMLQKSSSPP